MNPKVFVRHLAFENFNDREQVRDQLNEMGFYVLHAYDGLDVFAIKYDTPETLIEWVKSLFGGK